jgi:hypothetical protein
MTTVRVRSLYSKFFFESSTFKGRQFYKMSRHKAGKFKKTQVITIPPQELEDFKNFLKLILVELQSSPPLVTLKEYDIDSKFPEEEEEEEFPKEDEEIEDV